MSAPLLSGPPAAALLAAASTALALAALRALATRLRLVDRPDARHSHEKPTPRIGGLAVAAGVLAAGALIPNDPAAGTIGSREAAGVLAFLLLGFLDDVLRDRFPWAAKLALQAAIVLWYAAPLGARGPAAAALLLLGVNAANFFDHENLLLAAAAVPAALGLPPGPREALLAAVAVFAVVNARGGAFAGDAGSHALGFFAVAAALARERPWPERFAEGVAVLALPIADLLFVVALRVLRSTPPWRSTPDHLAHRFARAGCARVWAPAAVALWAVAFAAAMQFRGGGVSLEAAPLALLLVFLGAPPRAGAPVRRAGDDGISGSPVGSEARAPHHLRPPSRATLPATSMLDEELLKILADPKSKEPLRRATPEEIARLNEAIGKGGAKNQAGQAVSQPLSEALVAASAKRAYPIRDGIPVLLFDEAISLG